MLSNSVQIELFIILWVTKLIHNKQPMYAVLDKDTIKNEILPHLSVAKRGFQSKSSLIEVINAILYKLKTGCQWEYLPVKELFSGKVLKYGAVFHHYNKWSKKGEWKSLCCNFWTSTVRNLTCQVWILTEATLRLYAVGKKSAIREGKTQDDQCPLSYRQERASSRHVRSEKRGTS